MSTTFLVDRFDYVKGGEVMKLLKLKEFWTVVVDLAVSVALYFFGKYATPDIFEDVKFVILALQPVAALLIAVFATERIEVSISDVKAFLKYGTDL